MNRVIMDEFAIILCITAWQVVCEGCARLPVLDTGACLPQPVCNPRSPFRTPDGSCTNLHHPSWAQVSSPYARFKPANYHDDKKELRRSVNGLPLPPVRQLSYNFFPDCFAEDCKYTLMMMQWGQFMAHDITHLRNLVLGDGSAIKCCTNDGQFLQADDHINENCLPMEVSPQDPFYGQFNFRCLDYVRAGKVLNGTCYDYPIEQENQLTHTIDGSMIYGSDNKTAWSLRSFFGGKLLVQTTNDSRPFPPNSKSPHTDCRNPPSENICYVAGDDRVNQNIGITVCQILFLRLHNILCDKLTYLNPHWSDERLYQEARKIVGAVLQQITYKTYLPIILGEKYVKKYGLNISKCSSCTNHYDPAVNPSTISEFGAAAFRSFHSLVPRKIIFYDKCYKEYDFIYLDHYYFRPTIIQQPEVLDALIRGLAHQNPQRRDKCFSKTLTSYLFDNNDNDAFGTDEECFDMNRGRDMGLPPYNEIRALCGLKKAKSFEDFSDVMSMESVQKLKSFYFSHKDVDMFVGGMMERRIPGTMVGPTFQCIIGEQYYNYMRGDRFYFENCGLPWSFTKGQLNAIYEVSLAWVLCETGDNIESIQYDVFRQPNECNPIVPCKDIPQMDLEPWKEHI